MDKKLVYNYIQLCKKNDYNLINNISSDINLTIAPELVAQKYGVAINEVLGISEIIKYEHNLGCDGLKYVFDNYNLLVGGKGGKGKKSKTKNKNDSKKKNKDKKKDKKKENDDSGDEKNENDDDQKNDHHKHTNKDDDLDDVEDIGAGTGVAALAATVLSSNSTQSHHNQSHVVQKNTSQNPEIQKILSGLAALLSNNTQQKTSANLKEIKEIVSSEISDIFKKASKNLQSGGNKNMSHESSNISSIVLSD